MSRQLLTEEYFEDKEIKEMTAQRLIYSRLIMPELAELAAEEVRKTTNRAESERTLIQQGTDPEVLFNLLRKADPINSSLLEAKVLEYEEVLMPRILERLKSNKNEVFLTHAINILSKTNRNYSEALIDQLEEIWSPYAKSVLCLLLGFIADEKAIPLLMKAYEEFKKFYPDENYEQGPLFGLFRMDERFNGGVE